MTGLSDSFQRPINYLRISVTDRCNLRCIYCMPPEGVCLMPHAEILTYEEIHTVVEAAAELGISKVRITGGEPLVRAGLPELVRMLARIRTIDDISLTTNGMLLSRYATELKQAGLRRVNVSLDTLVPEKFRDITRGGNLNDTLEGIEIAKSVGLTPVKINVVIMPGINDNEVLDFARQTIYEDWHVRFIEQMPFTCKPTSISEFASASSVRQRLETLGKLEPCQVIGNGPAKYYRWPGAKGTIGFITPISEHFCFQCNRLRLTADGKLRPCLLSEREIDLRKSLRSSIDMARLKRLIMKAVANKPEGHQLAQGIVPHDRPFSQVGG